MGGCILTDPSGIQAKENIAHAAEALGSKIKSHVPMFCEFHRQHHLVKMEGAAVDRRYGMPHADVEISLEEEKALGMYQAKEFCRTCSSYHLVGQCRGARTRESVGS